MCIGFTALFQPPPLIEYFPVLHYVVSYNTSDNSTVIQTQLSSSIIIIIFITAGTGTDDKGVTELATVIYDTPHIIKEHNDQNAISTQDNVAYGGTIPLKQNEAYEQVHIN